MTARERLPADSYEEWLRHQDVRKARKRIEKKLPQDTFESWLQQEVKSKKSR